MTPHVAVAHYPEGAGHATRMMAVARALERRGATVSLTGGGPGERFYEPNGYAVDDVPCVDYVRDFQNAGGPVRGLARVVTESVPDSYRRISVLVDWVRREDPDALLTDDMFAAVAAARTGTPLYVLTHNGSGLYREHIVRVATRAVNLVQRLAARRFFYPTVWPPHGTDPEGVSRVPPVALPPPVGTDGAGPADPGVVLVPSTYSAGFDELAQRLRAAGYDVTHVGSDEWEPLPALLPLLRRADAIVCSGYSTVMEAAVAGTPCVVWPATNEQNGVARRVGDLAGFATAEDVAGIEAALRDPPAEPEYTNGVDAVAERILSDLGAPPGRERAETAISLERGA
ncbi:MAG: glycosyltransferase [Haloarculaceae archaeon]